MGEGERVGRAGGGPACIKLLYWRGPESRKKRQANTQTNKQTNKQTHKSVSFDYNMNGSVLSNVTFEKDLGVVVTGDLKSSKQCAATAARANRVLGLIKRNFNNFSKDIVLNLYKQLVRPHLDYAAQAWSPFYEKDKFLLEQVQRRATRLIPEVRNLPYQNRLNHLGLTTLELRRVRGDMLQVYKFLSDGNPLSSCNYLKVQSNSRVLGDCKKLVKGFARLDIRKFSFSHRVVNEWNGIVCLSGFLTQLLCTILKLT